MVSSWDCRRNRLLDLLAERAVFGLSGFEQQEVARLLAEFPDVDGDCMDRVAAEVVLAGATATLEPPPTRVRESLRRAACAYQGEPAWRPDKWGRLTGDNPGQSDTDQGNP